MDKQHLRQIVNIDPAFEAAWLDILAEIGTIVRCESNIKMPVKIGMDSAETSTDGTLIISCLVADQAGEMHVPPGKWAWQKPQDQP